MNCCHGKNDQHENGHGGNNKKHMSHMLMMILCCGAPVILLLLLPVLGGISPGFSSYVSKIIPFICPLMMFMMIPMMFKRENGNTDNKSCENKQIKENE